MKISIFGLGYVGAVSAGCLALAGHDVIGVDPVQVKVDMIAGGQSPIVEPGLPEVMSGAVDSGRLTATTDTRRAVLDSELSLVCVGTPSQMNGNLDSTAIRRVCEEIGACLREKDGAHVVVVRSTVLPGTIADVVIPTLEEASGRKCGHGLGVCMNPEFMRESSAVEDFNHPELTVVGQSDEAAGDKAAELYAHLDAPLVRTDYKTAEMVKYASNAWHALKIGFANEMGNLAKAVGVDGREVMDIFVQDRRLNIAPSYLKPGFAFGGSCLGKDLRALTYKARSLDLESPILSAILPGNELQVQRAFSMIAATGKRKVGILGLSFKPGTDDLRESPLVDLVEKLLGKGYEVRVYDRNVNLAKLVGANRYYILNVIPHIAKILVDDPQEIMDTCEVLVAGHGVKEFRELLAGRKTGQHLVDLVHLPGEQEGEDYDGICW